MKLGRVFNSLMFGLLLSCGDGSNNEGSTLDEVHQGSSNIRSLGAGFNSLRGEVTGSNCLENLPVRKISTGDARLDFYHDLSSEDLLDKMNGNVEISIPVYPGINAKGGVGFATEYASSKFSETYVLHYLAQVEQDRIYVEDLYSADIALNSRLKTVLESNDYSELQKQKTTQAMCGDQYVSVVDKGINIVAVLKINFATSQDRDAFSGMLGAELLGGVADIEVETEFAKQKINRETNIELAVFQKGGDPTGLLRALQTGDCVGSMCSDPFLQCSFETRHVCVEAYKRVLSFTQELDPTKSGLEYLAPIKVVTEDYPSEGVMGFVKPDMESLEKIRTGKEKLVKLRQSFLRYYDQLVLDESRLNDINSRFSLFLTKEYRERLENAKKAASSALELANVTSEKCWNRELTLENLDEMIQECELSLLTMKNALNDSGELAFDPNILDPKPMTFVEWCMMSNSPFLLNAESWLSYKKLQSYVISELDCIVNAGCSPENKLENLEGSLESRITSALQLLSDGPLTNEDEVRDVCTALHDGVNDPGFVSVDLSYDGSDNDFKLTTLSPLRTVPHLQKVVAENNYIKDNEGLEYITNLSILKLGGNRVENLESFKDLTWNQEHILSELDLSRNQIYTLSPDLTFVFAKKLVLDDNPLDMLSEPLQLSPSIESVTLFDTDSNEISFNILERHEFVVAGMNCVENGNIKTCIP